MKFNLVVAFAAVPNVTRRLYLLPTVIVLFLASPAAAMVIINQDMTLDASSPFNGDAIWIVDGPTGPTTVDILDGTDLASINVYGHSVVNVRGGRIQDDLAALDTSIANIYGGIVGAFEEDIWAVDSSTINIYGGVFGDDILADESGTVHLYGGHFVKDGGGATLGVGHDAMIHVYVQQFEIVPPDPLRGPRLVGTLSDGTSVNLGLLVAPEELGLAAIVPHTVPEPKGLNLALISASLFLVFVRIRACTERLFISKCMSPIKEDWNHVSMSSWQSVSLSPTGHRQRPYMADEPRKSTISSHFRRRVTGTPLHDGGI